MVPRRAAAMNPEQRVPETHNPCGVMVKPGCACNAYAQITAKCSAKQNHAFALYMSVRGDRVGGACYSEGSGKIQNDRSSRDVEAAVKLFCGYLSGRPLDTLANTHLADLLEASGHDRTLLDSVRRPTASSTGGELEDLRRTFGDAAVSLLVGGAIPYVLFNWALLNFEIKRAVTKVLGIAPGEPVRFREVDEMYALLGELREQPVLAGWGRSLELGVRALHLNTVDESSMRSAYQRGTYLHFLQEAERHGFLGNFQII